MAAGRIRIVKSGIHVQDLLDVYELPAISTATTIAANKSGPAAR